MLPVNFHKTFVPERRLIAALLGYAALGKQGTLQDISVDTGIPMGESSGKVPAILDYAKGMGLISIPTGKKSSIKKPVLTYFGRTVYSEDRYLGEKMVQWICHMNLCRPDVGALAWNAAFALGRKVIGSSFSKSQLEDYLVSVCGCGKDRTGPILLTYTDDAAFARAGVVDVVGEHVARRKAPILDSYAIPYSAYTLCLLEWLFPDQGQVTLSDFHDKALWFDVCLWSEADTEQAFGIMERTGYIAIDRQMQPWIIEPRATAHDVWQRIFDGLA